MPLGIVLEARANMLKIAKDFSPAAMLKIAGMAGLIEGVEGATSEAVVFACCQEILDRAHGRPRLGIGDENAGPLLVDFQWRDDAPRRLLEAGAIGCDDGETS